MSEEGSRRIVVNGQEYHSVEEMPPPIRAMYERVLGAAAEAGAAGAGPQASPGNLPGARDADAAPAGHEHVDVRVVTSQKYVVNGQEYASLDELPPGMAERVKQALASAGSPAVEAAPTRPAATAQAAARIPSFQEKRHVALRVSPIRLGLWIVAIVLIILLYLRRFH